MHDTVTYRDPPRSGLPPEWLHGLVATLPRWSVRLSRAAQLPNDLNAQDLVQETLCRLLARYGAAKLAEIPTRQVHALARRALKNLLVDSLRRRRASGEMACEQIDPADPVDSAVGTTRSLERLHAALATLEPGEHRFLLAVMQLDSVPAAQKRAGWPASSPYYQLRSLLARVRRLLDAD